MTKQEFLTNYKTLSETEKELLLLLTMAYEEMRQTNFSKLLNSLNILTDGGQKFTGKEVKEYIHALNEKGWVNFSAKGAFRCQPQYREWLMRTASVSLHFTEMVQVLERQLPYKQWMSPTSFEACLRTLRIAMYQGRMEKLHDVLTDLNRYYSTQWAESLILEEMFLPFRAKWLSTFPPGVQEMVISDLLGRALKNLDPLKVFQTFLENNFNLHKPQYHFAEWLYLIYIVTGQFDKLEALLPDSQTGLQLENLGIHSYLKNEPKMALTTFTEALKRHRKAIGKRNIYLDSIPGLLHVCAIMEVKSPADYIKAAHKHTKISSTSPYYSAFQFLDSTIFFQENQTFASRQLINSTTSSSTTDLIFEGFARYWTQQGLSQQFLMKLEARYAAVKQANYAWFALEFAAILSKISLTENLRAQYDKHRREAEKRLGIRSLIDIFKITEAWERALDALLSVKTGGKKGKGKAASGEARLVWLVDFKNQAIQPKEQKAGKTGKWSAGRNVALKRLKEGGVTSASQQDLQVSKTIQAETYSRGYYGYGTTEYYFDYEKAIKALVGHPHVFLLENSTISVELTQREPELIVEEKDGDFEMKFSHSFLEEGIKVIKETPTRYTVLDIKATHAEINMLLNGGNLRVPKKAKKRLTKAIGNLASILTVQSEVGGHGDDVPTVEGDTRPYIHLLPIGEGFKIEFFVKPFQKEPPYFKAGGGRTNIMAEIEGQKLLVKRDLKAEKKAVDKVLNAVPSLQVVEEYNGEYLFDEVENCLNVMVELEPLRAAGSIVMEYPQGEKLRIAGQAGFGDMSLQIKKDKDWFGLTGEIQVNENQVLNFQQLLALTSKSDSRFVELTDGSFLALTEQLRDKIRELEASMQKNKNGLRLNGLSVNLLEDFTDELGNFKADKAWRDTVKRLDDARNLNPKVPSTFKATLRNYQEDGYRWLSQLAHWGVGACLADDMGLGKTIQGLAVILDRAKDGAALVVAPASVARNWFRECHKFAPTMNPILFGSGDRKEMIKDLKPYDLLITSYGLMQSESELLSEYTFSTIILDEAQAIKNRATKRSKAAMELSGDFKILTTGTPIENHLGELWNLFNFLNPGLLGSLEHFNNKYALPIEKDKDKEKSQQLRRLIQPFILRRRKNEVLHELPEKTEVTLSVELSVEERAFYEALRRQALENIQRLDEGGEKRFQVLAELSRLRQACCHPKMVQPNTSISSSKLELFAETVRELIENGHKALVFSQFVKHLRIIEDWVKKEGISYQYLDGSTPMKKRDTAVQAFQGGEGDLFLISLKAGGTGLNLTAADYVLHLDPWWNPAVEDQASDRAHRMGQKRPVTIYRLVTEGTIEEKIVKLHGEKRDLADSLLSGTEASAKLSASDLLNLIKEA